MERLRPVFWGQGMFLEPQHFQQQDAYHETRLRQVVAMLAPHGWGIRTLAIREASLQNQVFEIERCEVLTFEGTVVHSRDTAGASNARIEPRSFEQALDPSGQPLSVYLGLPRVQLEETNLGSAADGGAEPRSAAGFDAAGTSAHRRYALHAADTADLYAGERQTAPLQYLVYQPRILFDVGEGRSQDYELIKIAQVERARDGKSGILSRRYVPPCLSVGDSSVLDDLLKDIRGLMTAKGQELAEYQERHGGTLADLSGRRLGQTLFTQLVNRYVPLLHHVLESGDVHPFPMYGVLRQLVGELSTFSDTVSNLGARRGQEPLPPYRHDELWPCFELAARRIRELVTEISTGPVSEVVLRHDGEFFAADLEQRLFVGDNRYYLAIRSDLPPSQLLRELQDTGKITSRVEMPKIQHAFLFGLGLESLEVFPDDLPKKAHYRYFLIDRRSEHWQKIQQAQNIAVHSTTLPPDTEIRLVVIFGE